jgi:hypothetical protein
MVAWVHSQSTFVCISSSSTTLDIRGGIVYTRIPNDSCKNVCTVIIVLSSLPVIVVDIVVVVLLLLLLPIRILLLLLDEDDDVEHCVAGSKDNALISFNAFTQRSGGRNDDSDDDDDDDNNDKLG